MLVNNAGVARDGILGMATDEDIDTVVDLNLKGTLYMSRLVSRRMLARRSGCIVNISSVVGRSGYRGLAVYSATKAAQEGMTRALARELGSRGIRVNAIAPGYLRTEMSHGLDEAPAAADRAPYAGRPAGRAGRHRPRVPVPHRPAQRLRHRPGAGDRRRPDRLDPAAEARHTRARISVPIE